MTALALLNNATLRVYREDRAEPYERAQRALVGTWRAHLSPRLVSVTEAGGRVARTEERYAASLPLNAADVLDHRCEVEDSRGVRYAVESATVSVGLGLDRCNAVLRRVDGVA